jgi:hypothetical protein
MDPRPTQHAREGSNRNRRLGVDRYCAASGNCGGHRWLFGVSSNTGINLTRFARRLSLARWAHGEGGVMGSLSAGSGGLAGPSSKRSSDILALGERKLRLRDYEDFLDALALQTRQSNIVVADHLQASCARCGAQYTREALDYLYIMGPTSSFRRRMGNAVLSSGDPGPAALRSGKCPACGDPGMLVRYEGVDAAGQGDSQGVAAAVFAAFENPHLLGNVQRRNRLLGLGGTWRRAGESIARSLRLLPRAGWGLLRGGLAVLALVLIVLAVLAFTGGGLVLIWQFVQGAWALVQAEWELLVALAVLAIAIPAVVYAYGCVAQSHDRRKAAKQTETQQRVLDGATEDVWHRGIPLNRVVKSRRLSPGDIAELLSAGDASLVEEARMLETLDVETIARTYHQLYLRDARKAVSLLAALDGETHAAVELRLPLAQRTPAVAPNDSTSSSHSE